MLVMARTRAQDYDPYSDWGVNPKGQQVNAMGQRKTIGFSPDRAPSRGFGGLNEHYTRQAYDGSPKAIEDYANDARKSGELVKKDGGRMLDTWENRGFKTHLSDKNPYAQPAAPAAPDAPGLPPGPISKENLDWANKPAPRDLGDRGNPAPMPRPVAGRTLDNKEWANKPAPKGGDGAAAPGGGGNDKPGSDEAPPEEPTDGGDGDSDGGDGGDGGDEPAPQPKPEDPSILKVPLPIVNRAATPPPMPSPMGNDNSGQAAPDFQGASGQDLSQAVAGMQSKSSPQPSSQSTNDMPMDANQISDRMSRLSSRPGPYSSPIGPATNDFFERANGSMFNRGAPAWASTVTRSNQPPSAVPAPSAITPSTPPPAAPRSAASPYQARADEIAAQRDFDRGEAPVTFDRPGNGVSQDGQGLMVASPLRATKINPYGTATATFGGPPTTGGTMEDPLTGATVPIKQWTNDQSAVQATKYGPGAAQAGADYLNPKRIAASTEPLGRDDAEQYRAIARGGKIPRSSKA